MNTSAYSKNYFEKYASLTLLKILDIEEDDITLSDCPDLVIKELDMGIEVTQAITTSEAVEDRKKALYTHLDMSPFDQVRKDKEKVLENIDDAIKRKQAKSEHYSKFKTNGLYIYSHCHNFKENEILSKLATYNNLFYQHIYINTVTRVYDYNLENQRIDSYHYSISELTLINEKSLDYEKTCGKKRRKIIV